MLVPAIAILLFLFLPNELALIIGVSILVGGLLVIGVWACWELAKSKLRMKNRNERDI